MTIPAFGDADAGASALDEAQLAQLCLDNLLSSEPEKFYFKDLGSRFVRVSSGHLHLFNVSTTDDVRGKTDFDFFTAEHAQAAWDAEQEIIRTGLPLVDLEERETWPDRPDSWVVTTKMPLRTHDGTVIGTFGMSRDITQRKRLEQELQAKTEALERVQGDLRRLLESSPDAMLRYDDTLRHVYVNPAAVALFGRPSQEILGRLCGELDFPGHVLDVWEPALRHVLASGEQSTVEIDVAAADNEPSLFFQALVVPERDTNGTVSGVFAIVRDLTARKRAEEALAARAVQDPLTGLANRVLLLDRLEQALRRLERQPGHLAVIFLDLDRFKVVNDSLGHAAGDAMLIEIASRLSVAARRSDTVARFGGDEFVILCERLSVDEDAAVIAARISRAFEKPFVYDNQPIHVTGSMGIAVTDGSATSAEELLRDADAAMYQAKERGHGSGSFQFFDPGIRARAVARMTLEGELRSALERDEFRLHYQPLVRLDGTQTIVGVEALIRWQHPQRGLLPPAEFMAVAEDSNLIVVIGRWVLDEACRQVAVWNAQRPDATPLGVAVNVSARQLAHQSLSKDVAAALERHAVEPHWLTIEMTETALLEEAVASGSTLNELSSLGVHIALDDFGTGYSSLSHLRRFPVDIIKIDRGFVSGLDSPTDDAPIVAAVTAMAHALGLTTIGEGIETAGQLQALQDLGCDEGQGYLLSHPLPATEVWALLQRT